MNLKSSIHPKRLTPQLMLAFIDYCDCWERLREGNRISPGERGKVDAIKASMLNYAIRVLFNDELRVASPQRLQLPGIQMARELFTGALKDLFPRYVALWNVGERAFDDYITALRSLSLKEKRGQKLLDGRRKSQLAQFFGIGSSSTFASRAKSNYASLMQLTETRGDEAQIKLLLHPMEMTLLKEFEKSEQRRPIKNQEAPTLSLRQFLDIANGEGYRDEEAGWILKLLVARELVQVDKQSETLYRVPAGPAPDEVKKQLNDLYSSIHGLPAALVTEREKTPFMTQIEELRQCFSPDLDEENMEELAIQANRLEEALKDLLTHKQQRLASELEELVLKKMEIRQRELTHAPELGEDIGPGLDFRRILLDMQRDLARERGKLSREIEQMRQNVIQLQRQVVTGGNVNEVLQLHTGNEKIKKDWQELDGRCVMLAGRRDGLKEWLKLLKESDELYKSLETLPDLRARLTDDIVRRIMQNFSKRGLAALAEDAEQFRNEFDELARQRDTWVSAKRDEFHARKEGRRLWLKAMGVDKPDFPARYEHLEHDQSYEDMYNQVMTIARQHIEGIRKKLDDLRLDLRRVRQIQWAKLEADEREILKGLEKDYDKLEKHREVTAQKLEKFNLTQTDDALLDDFAQDVKSVLTEIEHASKDSRQFLQPTSPKTDSEKAVLNLLKEQREIDLTDLVLKTEKELPDIMDGLIGLYQGNQVIIKVSRRG
jgi:hypothetical protein